MIIQYNKGVQVLNIDQLPAGTGCKWLQCLSNHEGQTLKPIAVRWCRKKPVNHDGYVYIKF